MENKKSIQKFVALSGIQDPLTTYDSYGYFNGIFHFDDFPYYDSSYEDLLYKLREKLPPNNAKDFGSILYPRDNIEDFSKDSFLYSEGRLTRRELVPSNYTDHPEFADAQFEQHKHNYILINTARGKDSSVPAWPSNVYFNK